MISNIFQSVLWDYDLEKLSYDDDIVIVRTCNLGDKHQVDFLKKQLGAKKFKEKVIKNMSNFDKKTANYWAVVFDLKSNLNNNQSVYEQLNKAIFTRSFR